MSLLAAHIYGAALEVNLPLHLSQKRPTFPQKNRISLHLNLPPAIQAAPMSGVMHKKPHISAKEPYISAIQPHISAKEPYILVFEFSPCIQAAPRSGAMHKRALYFRKRAPYIRSRVIRYMRYDEWYRL